AVYDIQPGSAAAASTLKVSESGLENERYRVTLDDNGDVSSIFDKKLNKELLSAPARLAFMHEAPHDWPAWNMDWNDQQQPPYGYVQGSPQVRIVENGSVRVALEITRESEGMKFVQTIRLASGDAGNRVEFGLDVDWKGKATALKAAFPLAASNPKATYNWDIGTIERANNDPKKYEVPSHQWFDLTDSSGAFGTTILSNDKYGSDKPDNNLLRLTLIYTPGLGEGNGKDYDDQTTQDWGHHEIWYGLAGHAGDWRQEQTDWQGFRLNQPLVAFVSSKHNGAMGKTLSLLKVSNPRIRVLALKKAEAGNDFVVRVVEMSGQAQPNVRLGFAAPVVSARELDGQERPIGAATPKAGALVTSFTPYQVRTFAVKLAPPKALAATPHSMPMKLAYDRAVATSDGAASNGNGFDAQGNALASEMLPREISFSGIRFALGPGTGKNAVTAHGQEIALPPGQFNRVYVLAAADGDQQGTFKVGTATRDLRVEDWGGFIGQWDTRTWNEHRVEVPGQREPDIKLEYTGLKPGYIKRAAVAWFASHRHNAAGQNEPYSYSYLFALPLEVPAGAHSITLPDNDKIRVLAITAARVAGQIRPAASLYDRLDYKIDPAMYAPAAASGQ
ncbi:MAG TPA: glycoside hydrolase family 38 C-terminal domain-containing protein, partial [Terriglobales bacterium]|nr:glycoside hydrolase family 38 C-terminal domain-containing protein [Terriglobales bacterium]